MNLIEQLQFKLEVNKALKRGTTFDELVKQYGFTITMAMFLKGKIGKIWLKSEQGWDYRIWQGT